MDEKQELNDLLIEDDEFEESSGSSKKILLIGAAALILFLMAIFVVYSVNRGDDPAVSQSAPLPDAEPEAIEQPVESSVLDEKPLFEQVPIEEEDPAAMNQKDEFEKIVDEIKQKQVQKPVSAPTKPIPMQPTQTEKPEKVPTPAVSKPEPAASKPKAAETSMPKPSGSVPAGFYVQVGAFFKFTPDKQFIRAITEHHFSYELLKTSQNGKEVTKVLVGPFGTRSEANQALATIKEKINSRAFIKKI